MAGAGTLVLTAANTYTGATTLTSGTLTAGNTTALGTGTLALNGGTLQARARLPLAHSFTGGRPGPIGRNKKLPLQRGGDLTRNNTITSNQPGTVPNVGALN